MPEIRVTVSEKFDKLLEELLETGHKPKHFYLHIHKFLFERINEKETILD